MRIISSSISLIVASAALTAPAPAQSVLFVRGGSGTGGFLSGGSDSHLCDITDDSTEGGNHGWGQLSDLLEADGFVLSQVLEGPVEDNTPVDFAGLDLAAYDVIVLGSNNVAYGREAVDAVEAWVRAGGGLLAISDANFGQSWGDAPSSDQDFLDRFGLIMNQDRETYAVCRADGDFIVGGVDQGDHPLLTLIDCFDGEGVSPISLGPDVPGVTSRVLAGAEGMIRVNDSDGAGSLRPANDGDGALTIALADAGRVAGHFDRNTFFNANGTGTDITRFDNAAYALELFRWLAAGACPDVDGDGMVGFGDLLAVLSAWGPCVCSEDIDGSGAVDLGDLLLVLSNWSGGC